MGGLLDGGTPDAELVQISARVADHFTATSVGGTAVYDLTEAAR
jgi:hypothetical protein